MKSIPRLLRLPQYIKNLFIFLPLFFGNEIFNAPLMWNAFVAFIAFSLSASSIYILNDLHDIHDDRNHPVKRYRPLASGAISSSLAITIMCMAFVAGFSLMIILSVKAGLILSVYLLMNVGYTYKLKHIPILDLMVVATGFVIRLIVGSVATGVALSKWIVLITFLLAFLLSLGKRRDDILILNDKGLKTRNNLEGYNLPFIEGAMMLMAAVTIVTYILYTTSEDIIERLANDYLYLTSIFVIFGILRYLQITIVENQSGNPTNIVLHDRIIQFTLLLWIGFFLWIIYL